MNDITGEFHMIITKVYDSEGECIATTNSIVPGLYKETLMNQYEGCRKPNKICRICGFTAWKMANWRRRFVNGVCGECRKDYEAIFGESVREIGQCHIGPQSVVSRPESILEDDYKAV